MTTFILGTSMATAIFSGFVVFLSLIPPAKPDDQEFRAYGWLGLAISLSVFLGATYARSLP